MTYTQSPKEHATIVGLSADRISASLLGSGAFGLVATCICYVLAGPEAALPGGGLNPAASLAATAQAASWMRAAGLFGMPSDVLLAVASLLLAGHEFKRDETLLCAGWLGMAVAATLFVVVDAMVAFVLPTATVSLSVYASFRAMFDVLFAFGAWTVGCAAMALSWHATGALFRWPVIGWGMRVAGLVCLSASSTYLLTNVGGQLIGLGIALVALASFGVAVAHLKATATK
jgi:hypothetical protein